MNRNLRSIRSRRRNGRNIFQEFDQLPKPLRIWLAQAALPWSARSARKYWRQAMKEANGCEKRAMETMTRIEKTSLEKDAQKVWGIAPQTKGASSREAIH